MGLTLCYHSQREPYALKGNFFHIFVDFYAYVSVCCLSTDICHGCEDAAVFSFLQTQQRALQEQAVPPRGRWGEIMQQNWRKLNIDEIPVIYIYALSSIIQFPQRRRSHVCPPRHPGVVTVKEQAASVAAPKSISPPRPGCLLDISWTATSTQWTPRIEEDRRLQRRNVCWFPLVLWASAADVEVW